MRIIKIAIKIVSQTSNCENSYNKKQYIFEVVNNAWNFHSPRIHAVIQVACVVSWTSIFTRQMIVVTDFFMVWRRLSSSWRCCIPSIVLRSATS